MFDAFLVKRRTQQKSGMLSGGQGGLVSGGFMTKVKSFFPLLQQDVRKQVVEDLKDARANVKEKRGKA